MRYAERTKEPSTETTQSNQPRQSSPEPVTRSGDHSTYTLELQQTLGNQAVQGLHRGGELQRQPRHHVRSPRTQRFPGAGPLVAHGVQAKLTVGHPDDEYEREADAVAEAVAAGKSAPTVSPLPAGRLDRTIGQRPARVDPAPSLGGEATSRTTTGAAPALQRETVEEEEGEEQEEPVQRAVAGATRHLPAVPPDGATAATIRRPGAGAPLPESVRTRLEPGLDANLEGVQVHTDAAAATAARRLNARAFTHRNHIFLGAGASAYDVRLMAHEATHVVQQNAAPRATPAVQRDEEEEGGILDTIGSGISELASDVGLSLDSLPGVDAAEIARMVPGYSLFTVIIGYNPLTNESVEFTPANLLRGLFGLIPVVGDKIYNALAEWEILQETFTWVNDQLETYGLTVRQIRAFLDRLLDRATDALTGPGDVKDVVVAELRSFARGFLGFANAVKDRVIELVREAAASAAEALLEDNDAWALVKKVLGRDPLRDERVEATPTEILEDFLLLIGKEQHLEQMRQRGTVEQTAEWLATQIGTVRELLVELGSLVSRLWETIVPENLPNLRNNIDRLVTDASTFFRRAIEFAGTVAAEVLSLIKDALLGWLSEMVERELPGFDLLTVIIERNPFTGEQVARTAENLIRGFITLIPGGRDVYEQLAESGTLAAAGARIDSAVEQLGISWDFVVGLFTDIWESVSIEDLAEPIETVMRLVERFGEPVSRLLAFVNVVLREVFFLVLQAMNFPTDLIGSIITNVMQAIEDIKTDPVGFLLNMLRAVKTGFERFFGDILVHLGGGLADWLFRGLRDAGVEPPTDFSLGAVLEFVLQVLGISIDHIWELLGERIGEENVDRIRGAIDRLTGIWNFVRDVQERGVAAIWEYIESQITGLWDMVLETAQEWIMERVINRGIQWLLSLLDPTGIMPVINSFVAFFNAVQSAIEYARDILAIVNDYVTTLAAVARGDIAAGAARLQEGLANAVPVAIGFLANQFGLGNVAEKIQEIVQGIREMVDEALGWLIDRAASGVQSLLRMIGIGGEEEEEVTREDQAGAEEELDQWWSVRYPFTDATNDSHTLLFRGSGEGATLVVHSSDEKVVSDWLVTRRESASEGFRPVIEEALVAYDRWLQRKNEMNALDREWQQLSDEERDTRRAERETVRSLYQSALENLMRALRAIPIEAGEERLTLNIPSQKQRGPYENHRRLLAHRVGRYRKLKPNQTKQKNNWTKYVNLNPNAEIMGRNLIRRGIIEDESRLLVPNWTQNGTEVEFHVDHIIEWQVRPLDNNAWMDQEWNYELLDGRSNQESGNAMKQYIEELRRSLADETGDASWLVRDVEEFNEVSGGGSDGYRWSLEEISRGDHVVAKADAEGITREELLQPIHEGELAERDERLSETDETPERREELEALIQSLEADHPGDAGEIRSFITQLLHNKRFPEIQEELGKSNVEFERLKTLINQRFVEEGGLQLRWWHHKT